MLKILSCAFLLLGIIIIGVALVYAKKQDLKGLVTESSKLQVDSYEIEEDNSVTDLYDDMSSIGENVDNFEDSSSSRLPVKEMNVVNEDTEILEVNEDTEMMSQEKAHEENTELLFTEDEVTELLG